MLNLLTGIINYSTQLISPRVFRGVSKITQCELLSHTTSYSHFTNILFNGVNPETAQQKAVNQKNKLFFVFRDAKAPCFSREFQARVFAASHASRNLFVQWITIVSPPRVHFFYKRDEMEKIFQPDSILEERKKANGPSTKDIESYHEFALQTSSSIPNTRINLVGALSQLSPSNLLSTWKTDKVEMLTGIAQISLGVLITYVKVQAIIYGINAISRIATYSISRI